jgi:hypothetical protein
MKHLMPHETVLYFTEDGCVKAVRIMATVGENLVFIDKDTTSEPLQTAHQLTWWYSQSSPILGKLNAGANTDITYQTHSTKQIPGLQDLPLDTGPRSLINYSE